MEGEGEGEKHQYVVASHAPLLGNWPAAQACTLSWNRTSDTLVHRPTFNILNHTSPGPLLSFFGLTSSADCQTFLLGSSFIYSYPKFLQTEFLPSPSSPIFPEAPYLLSARLS